MTIDEILNALDRLQALEHDRRGMQLRYSSDHYISRMDKLLQLLDKRMEEPAPTDTVAPAQPVAVGNDGIPF